MKREAFLARVAASLGRHEDGAATEQAGALPAYASPVPARSGLPEEYDALAELFTVRLAAAGGRAHRVATRSHALEAIVRLLVEREAATLACPPRLRWPAVAGLCTEDVEHAAFGLAEAERGVAETGSVLLVHGGEDGRRASLLPPAVGFLLPGSRLVASVGLALDAVCGTDCRPPVCATFVTGASHSADIACVPCYGVHGPGEVHVWVIEDE